MSNSLVNSLTGYLAHITTKLKDLIQNPKLEDIEAINKQCEQILQMQSKLQYQKPNAWNYLQYFNYLLRLSDCQLIKLYRKNDPFTMKQDIFLLTTVSNNQTQLPFKVFEKTLKNNQIYGINNRNQRFKRPINKMFQRYRLLMKVLNENHIQQIIKWIQQNGINKQCYLHINNTFNVFIKAIPPAIIKAKQVKPNKKRNLPTQPLCDREQNLSKIIKVNEDLTIKDQSITPYQTPQKRINNFVPKAPKKLISNGKMSEELIERIFAPPKQNRRIVHVAGPKQQSIVKSEVLKQQESEQLQEKANYSSDIKTTQHLKTQDFMILKAPQAKQTQKEFRQQKPSQQISQAILAEQINPNQLTKILQQFKQKTTLSQLKILKYLDELSGDLNALRKYLQTEDQTMKWKRLEDLVLRNHYKAVKESSYTKESSYVKGSSNIKESSYVKGSIKLNDIKAINLHNMYLKIVQDKGIKSVDKRIAYLGLNK